MLPIPSTVLHSACTSLAAEWIWVGWIGLVQAPEGGTQRLLDYKLQPTLGKVCQLLALCSGWQTFAEIGQVNPAQAWDSAVLLTPCYHHLQQHWFSLLDSCCADKVAQPPTHGTTLQCRQSPLYFTGFVLLTPGLVLAQGMRKSGSRSPHQKILHLNFSLSQKKCSNQKPMV